jgi:hypothetical protein
MNIGTLYSFTQCSILLCGLFFLSVIPVSAIADSSRVVHISAEILQSGKGKSLTREVWRYRAGDDSTFRWASLDFDDSAWDTLRPGRRAPMLPEGLGRGLGIFRLKFTVDSALHGVPVLLELLQYGAMEIFLDGKRIYRLGTIGQSEATTTPYLAAGDGLGITFDDKPYHVLAIRYAAFDELTMSEMNPLRNDERISK